MLCKGILNRRKKYFFVNAPCRFLFLRIKILNFLASIFQKRDTAAWEELFLGEEKRYFFCSKVCLCSFFGILWTVPGLGVCFFNSKLENSKFWPPGMTEKIWKMWKTIWEFVINEQDVKINDERTLVTVMIFYWVGTRHHWYIT